MDLNLLNQPLPVVENPGLETTDPRLEEVSSLVQGGHYMEAAKGAEGVLAEGIYDIRVIGFFLYGVFLEEGIESLGKIFDCYSGLLGENWAALGPVPKREKHAQTSFRWLINQLLKKLQYEENAKGELWEQWVSTVSSDAVEEILEAADRFRRACSAALEEAAAPLIDGLSKLTQWLHAFQQIVYRENEPQPEAEAEEPAEEEDMEPPEDPETMDSPRPAFAPGAAPASRVSPDQEGTWVEGSYHLRVLLDKMEAFERLISEEKFPRAALVAEDINDAIAGFDPRVYFPKLFARFAFLQAAHVQDLIAYEDEKQSAEWQALKDFYRVDLRGFVES